MKPNLKQLAPNVGFGTSGVRALVADLSPTVVWAYTQVFVAHMRQTQAQPITRCVLAWDLRPSSPGLAAAAAAALADLGIQTEWAGPVPTPAMALRCLALQCPGIKFYTPRGEILKTDEAAMTAMDVPELPDPAQLQASLTADTQALHASLELPSAALLGYQQRYQQLLPATALQGMRVGVYQHSAVGRDFLARLLQMLGATVVALGRSDQFVPIDTEAVSPQDEAQAALWCQTHQLNAVVSTDGDGDRPWVCDEHGRFMRGDILCTLLAQWLEASHVVTPVSSNTAVELSGRFASTLRTRIGSPYVIEAMQAMQAQGQNGIVGFEANGGFLLQSPLRGLSPLPTRDSTLPIVAILAMAREHCLPLSALPQQLPARFTQSGRIQGVATAASQAFIAHLSQDPAALAGFTAFTGSAPAQNNQTDGLRIGLANGDVLHLRPSGNAPELRCYTESTTPEQAQALLNQALTQLQQALH